MRYPISSIPQYRHGNVCGVVDKGDDGVEVVLAGGVPFPGEREDLSLTLDIFNFKTFMWRTVGEITKSNMSRFC